MLVPRATFKVRRLASSALPLISRDASCIKLLATGPIVISMKDPLSVARPRRDCEMEN